ncbi:MAG: hypothetical protein JNL90_12235 [Planctomycetes bacterium]|nr:hypothetical protein [Planctomycetota bacterium]
MRPTRFVLGLAAALAGLAWTAGAVARSSDDPKPSHTTRSKGVKQRYVTKTFHGFTVHVDERLLAAQREVGDAALGELERQLAQIERKVRAEPLAELRTIAIWLGVDDPVAPCACYHPSPEWLRQNDFDPQKAKAVEIANAANFVSWTREQPWMVLHELAHGFDDRRLQAGDGPGSQGARLEELFTAAKAAGHYDEVLHWNGEPTRHYAMNTSDEYFAEASEAWFGCNDFFPFVQAELLRHDPALAAFLREVWGEPLTSRG